LGRLARLGGESGQDQDRGEEPADARSHT
jgi:hypothetical protein